VLAALRAVARRADGRDPAANPGGPLSDRLCRAFGVESPAQIPSALYTPGADRAWIAGLAPAVLAAADDDPGAVLPILTEAGSALAEQVDAVAGALGLPRDGLPLAMGGSFLLSAGAVAGALFAALAARGYRAEPTAVPDPVRGAVVLAERGLAGG